MDEHERPASWPGRLYLWATRRLYNELAWAYDPVSWLVSLGRWSHWRRQTLAHVQGPRVLEIGFGTGELLIEMARRGWQAVGLERSPAMQRVTARKVRRRSVSAPRLLADAAAMPFAGGCLDAIVCTFPAAYILSALTWQEAARILRPGGRLIIAGLFVELDATLLPRALRPPHERAVAGIGGRLQALAAASHLSLTRHDEAGARLRAPVFVARKGGGPPGEAP